MAHADSREMPRARRARERVRVAHRSAGKPVSKGVRWDRLPGNWLLVILAVMAILYVPPLKGYYEQRKAASAAKAHLQQLGKENRALKARARSLTRDSTIELEARKLGMVSPDERPFVIVR
jgi:cell division protein FtsL